MFHLTSLFDKATELGGISDKTTKPEVMYQSRCTCGTIKFLRCAMAINAEHMPEFCAEPISQFQQMKHNVRGKIDNFFQTSTCTFEFDG